MVSICPSRYRVEPNSKYLGLWSLQHSQNKNEVSRSMQSKDTGIYASNQLHFARNLPHNQNLRGTSRGPTVVKLQIKTIHI